MLAFSDASIPQIYKNNPFYEDLIKMPANPHIDKSDLGLGITGRLTKEVLEKNPKYNVVLNIGKHSFLWSDISDKKIKLRILKNLLAPSSPLNTIIDRFGSVGTLLALDHDFKSIVPETGAYKLDYIIVQFEYSDKKFTHSTSALLTASDLLDFVEVVSFTNEKL